MSETLREIVQNFRETARDILRMKNINTLLQELFGTEKELTRVQKVLDTVGDRAAREAYKLSQLDPEDPDFNQKKKQAEKNVDTAIENDKRLKENTENYIVELEKEIKDINEKISDYESGKTKVSIEAIQNLSDEMIRNSYKN